MSADLASRGVVYLGVSRNAGTFARVGVLIDGMPGAFSAKFTPMLLQVFQQSATLHKASDSRITSLPSSCFSASSRLTSKRSWIASLRFSRASSMVPPCVMASGISRQLATHQPSSPRSYIAVYFSINAPFLEQRALTQFQGIIPGERSDPQ